MIKLNREPEPQYMVDNKATWLKNLKDAIASYGSYKTIPEKEKQKLISHYRNEHVRCALIKSSYGKCAFCECIPSEGGNVEVEHFKPKSIYPELTFEWNNFLPSCRKCNGSKDSHDTGIEPIINPYDIDPKDVFYFEDIEIKAVESSLKESADKTIEVCGLNTVRLWKPRAEILVSLRIFSRAIDEALEEIKNADTERKKANRIKKLREAVETIETLTYPGEKYSSFCRDFLEKSQVYHNAKRLLEYA
ncbi:hypothetical protein K0J45_09700 [Shewanella alkalitolerans]|uniref:hypothetical protein n=1 Tax=Shewanella alkalitolerans TaxID=2864209 RepID=UPI001C65B7BD|nr:hypothetical protein [Shewanella alkalitolerans]QYJ99440.1 hypothetical protein K0J45_09700 [Shewanella alkalitolerans]